MPNGGLRRETFFEGRSEGGPLTLTNIPSVARQKGLRPATGFEELPVAPERKSVLEMDLEEKQGLRQRVIDEGKRLGAQDAEIGQVLKARGLSDLQAPERKIIKDVAGVQRFVDTGERVFREVEKPITAKEKLEEIKLTSAEKKESLREESKLTKAKIISGKAAKALGQTGFLTTGFVGSMLSAIPGTPAYDLDKTVDTIKANLGFEELAAMRASSPTGGALGQIAVRELEFLQRAMDALEQGQTREQFEEALIAVKTHYDNVIKNIETGKQAGVPTGGAPQEGVTTGGELTTAEQAELEDLRRRFPG
ncbi:hypothetical protein KAR91_12530 [Candidatus Pacearchaeota archaeon]|nr:hypothetical protein [Candidatus Pacearchaeota archaeon]